MKEIINSGRAKKISKHINERNRNVQPLSFINVKSMKYNNINNRQKSETKGQVVTCSLDIRKKKEIIKAINGCILYTVKHINNKTGMATINIL